MKKQLDKILKLWIECELETHPDLDIADPEELLARVLCEWEECGDAMRGLDRRGRVCWKASPQMLERLADQEREAKDDLRNK